MTFIDSRLSHGFVVARIGLLFVSTQRYRSDQDRTNQARDLFFILKVIYITLFLYEPVRVQK